MLNTDCKTKAVGPVLGCKPDFISKPLKHADIQGQSGLKSCLRTGPHADTARNRDSFLEMLPFSIVVNKCFLCVIIKDLSSSESLEILQNNQEAERKRQCFANDPSACAVSHL